MHFDSGKLNKRISFLTYDEVLNEIGQTIQGETVYKTVYASVSPVRSYEQSTEDRLKSEVVYKIITRYYSGICSDMTINYNGKLLEITQVIDIDGGQYALEIIAIEKVQQ